MEKIAPGIFDDKTGTAASLVAAAESAGLDPEVIVPLTDPNAIIHVPDGKGGYGRFLLGKGAVSVVAMLARLKAASETGAKSPANGDAPAFSKEDVEKAKAEAVADALKKLKIPEARFQSLGGSPSAGGDTPAKTGDLSEEQFARLLPKEQDAYLRGEL